MSALKILLPIAVLAGAGGGVYYAYTQGALDRYLPAHLSYDPPPAPLRPTLGPDEIAWDGIDKTNLQAVRTFLATAQTPRVQAEAQAIVARMDSDAFASAQAIDDQPSYESYLANFPTGANVELARLRLAEIVGPAPAPETAPEASPETAPAAPSTDPAAPAKPAVAAPAKPSPAAPLTKPTPPAPKAPTAAKAAPTTPPAGSPAARIEAGYIIGAPWLERPTGADLDDAYPPFALNLDISGQAQLDCLVLSTGHLKCDITGESPAGRSFGGAGIAASKKFRMAQRLANGTPTAGLRARLQLTFKPPPKGQGTF